MPKTVGFGLSLIAATMLVLASASVAAAKTATVTRPLSLSEDSNRLSRSAGVVRIKGNKASGEIVGQGVMGLHHVVFVAKWKAKLSRDGLYVENAKIKGKAYWVDESESIRGISSARMTGWNDGWLTDLSWSLQCDLGGWSGPAEVHEDTDVYVVPPLSDLACALSSASGAEGQRQWRYSDDGRSWSSIGDDRGVSGKLRFKRSTQSMSAKVISGVGVDSERLKMSALPVVDGYFREYYLGIYTQERRGLADTRPDVGIVTFGDPGELPIQNPALHVIQNDGSATLAEVEGGWLLTQTPGSHVVEVGTVLVSTEGTGAILRVTAVTEQSGNSLLLQGEPGTLEDIYTSGHFELEVDGDDLEFTAESAGAPSGQRLADGSVSAGLIYDAADLTVTIDAGSVEFVPDVKADCEFGLTGVETAFFEVTGTLETSADFTISVSGAALTEKAVALGPRLRSLFVYQPPGLAPPVIGELFLTTKAKVALGLTGHATLTTGFDSSHGLSMRISYTKANGWQWQPTPIAELNGHGVDWDLVGEAGAKVSIYPEVEVRLYSTVGVVVSPAAFAEITAESSLQGNRIDWELAAGLGLDVRLYAQLLSEKLQAYVDYSTEWRTVLASGSIALPSEPSWAVGFGDSQVEDLTLLASGDLLVTGSMPGSMSFGNGVNLSDIGDLDGDPHFVVLLDEGGTAQWAASVERGYRSYYDYFVGALRLVDRSTGGGWLIGSKNDGYGEQGALFHTGSGDAYVDLSGMTSGAFAGVLDGDGALDWASVIMTSDGEYPGSPRFREGPQGGLLLWSSPSATSEVTIGRSGKNRVTLGLSYSYYGGSQVVGFLDKDGGAVWGAVFDAFDYGGLSAVDLLADGSAVALAREASDYYYYYPTELSLVTFDDEGGLDAITALGSAFDGLKVEDMDADSDIGITALLRYSGDVPIGDLDGDSRFEVDGSVGYGSNYGLLVTRFSLGGQLQWARPICGSVGLLDSFYDYEYGSAQDTGHGTFGMAVLEDGTVIVGLGFHDQQLIVASDADSATYVGSSDVRDGDATVALLAFDTDGDLVWTRTAPGSSGTAGVEGTRIDGGGGRVVTGGRFWDGTVTFGDAVSLSYSSGYDYYGPFGYDASGFVWSVPSDGE